MVHGTHKIEIVRRLLTPARLVRVPGEAQVHARVEPGEAAFRGQLQHFVHNGAGIDLHAPEGGLQTENHFLGQDAEIACLGEVAVGVQIGMEARVVPDHFGHGDA